MAAISGLDAVAGLAVVADLDWIVSLVKVSLSGTFTMIEAVVVVIVVVVLGKEVFVVSRK